MWTYSSWLDYIDISLETIYNGSAFMYFYRSIIYNNINSIFLMTKCYLNNAYWNRRLECVWQNNLYSEGIKIDISWCPLYQVPNNQTIWITIAVLISRPLLWWVQNDYSYYLWITLWIKDSSRGQIYTIVCDIF